MQVQRLIVVGNSHMRITFQYLMNAMGHINGTNFQTYVKDTITLGQKFTYSWHKSGTEVANFLTAQNNVSWSEIIPSNFSVLRNERTSAIDKKNIVIMSTGSLDLRSDCVSHFCDVIVPLLAQSIAKTKEVMGDKVKLIYVTQPPIGEEFKHATGLRNNVAIGAANAVTIDALQNIDVSIVDGYNMQLPRFKEYADPIHYTQVKLVNRTSLLSEPQLQFYGDVGIAVINAILNTFC